jgi:RING finger protein 121
MLSYGDAIALVLSFGASRYVAANEHVQVQQRDPRMRVHQRLRDMHASHGGHHHWHHRMRPADKQAPYIFFMLVAFMVGAQSALYYWKRKHPISFNAVTLCGLLIIPFSVSCYMKWFRFVGLVTIYACVMSFYVSLAFKKNMDAKTPRKIYDFFFTSYQAAYGVGFAGYVMIMADFVGIQQLLMLPRSFAAVGFQLFYHGLYFGVVGRDIAELCAEYIKNSLGYCAKKDDDMEVEIPANLCALCGEDFPEDCIHLDANETVPKGVMAMEYQYDLDEMEGEEAFEKPKDKCIRLECGHIFHEACIRGWVLVGKKDRCPRCGQKVSLSAVTGTSPWETQSLLWVHLLDALRYLIVWNPLILVVTKFALQAFGY